MSMETVYDRRILIIPVEALRVKDQYGNLETYEMPKISVPARRRFSDSSEVDTDRNQQTQRFVYLVPPGTRVKGDCKIIDNDVELEVIGTPNVVKTQFIEHHVEFEARSIVG